MKRAFLILWMIQVVVGPLAAQKDPGALLAGAEYRFSELESYACELVMQVRGPNGPLSEERGQFYARKGSYHVDFHEDQMICDGMELQTWSKAFADANIRPYEPASDLSLMGVYHLYQRAAGMEYLGEEDGMDKIRVRGGGDIFPEKLIWVGQESGLIERYELVTAPGRSYYYQVEAQRLNPTLDEGLLEIDRDFVAKVQRGEVPAVEHHHEAADDGHGHDHHNGDEHEHDGGGGN